MTFVAIYIIAAAIALAVLLHHVRFTDLEPRPKDVLVTLVVCIIFAAIWPSLLAGVLIGKSLKEDK